MLKIICILILSSISLNVMAIKTINIALVGNGNTGKSSLVRKLIFNNILENSVPQVGIDYHYYKMKTFEDDIIFKLYDFPGLDHYFKASKHILKTKIDVFIYVFDCSDKNSLNSMNKLIKKIDHISNKQIPKIIVANKNDLSGGYNPLEQETIKVAKRQKALYFQTSAKEENNLKEILSYISSLPIHKDQLRKDNNENDVIIKRLGLKESYLLGYYFIQKKSHLSYLNKISEKEKQNHIDYCIKKLNNFKRNNLKKLSPEEKSFLSFYFSLSSNFIFFSDEIRDLLLEKINYYNFKYLAAIVEEWHVEIEEDYNLLDMNLNKFRSYAEVENDYQTLLKTLIKIACSHTQFKELQPTITYFQKMLEVSKHRFGLHLKYNNIEYKLIEEILRDSCKTDSPYNENEGRCSSVYDMIISSKYKFSKN